MKIIISKLRILVLLLVALPCGVPAFAVLPMASAQPADTAAEETPLSQVGSRLRLSDLDCSHLVHAIYESVGLHYEYATSRVLYRGTTNFRRVLRPNPGDLVAWRGHVGIVVDPSRHIFLSVLKTGVKASSYVSDYW
jgi:cell wall-associated NlpC family hydrolase